MELKVNDQKLDITLEGEQTVGDVLKSFEEIAAENEATTISIRVDGKDIPAEEFNNVLSQKIEESTVIELSVISSKEVTAMVVHSGQSFKETSVLLKEISSLLQSGKDKEAYEIIGKLAEQIDYFCHAVTLSALFPSIYEKLSVNNMEMSKFFEEFAPLLQDFEDAFQNKDTVTIGDLAEYEISPRLESITESIEKTFN